MKYLVVSAMQEDTAEDQRRTMETILRVTTRQGEVIDLIRPDRNDEVGWLQIYAIVGNAVRIEEIYGE